MASHGMVPQYSLNPSSSRSELTNTISNCLPSSLILLYVLTSSGVNPRHGGHYNAWSGLTGLDQGIMGTEICQYLQTSSCIFLRVWTLNGRPLFSDKQTEIRICKFVNNLNFNFTQTGFKGSLPAQWPMNESCISAYPVSWEVDSKCFSFNSLHKVDLFWVISFMLEHLATDQLRQRLGVPRELFPSRVTCYLRNKMYVFNLTYQILIMIMQENISLSMLLCPGSSSPSHSWP